MDYQKLKNSVAQIRRDVLDDGRVNKVEAELLLKFAEQSPQTREMRDFAIDLKRALEDNEITHEESVRLAMHLDWLAREVFPAEPDVGFLGKLFKLGTKRTTIKTELMAGLTTFMTMAYILAVNPNLLSMAGIPRGGVFVATALAAIAGTLLMAFMSNYPFVLAPGMGLNAFLTFGVCFGMGYSWQFALFAVFVEGLVFLALSLTPVRESIFNSIPFAIKKAVAAGIGLFICFIAFQTAKVIVDNPATLVGLQSFKHFGSNMHQITAALAILGTILTGVLLALRVKGAILFGIFITWGLGMLAQVTGIYVPNPEIGCFSTYPSFTMGDIAGVFKEFGTTCGAVFNADGWQHFNDKKEVIASGWTLIRGLDFFVVMFAFFFVDLFDTLGTLIGVSMKGGFLTKEGKLPRISGALCADAIATSVGAVFGTSTTTTYVESASGVMAGGRTGLTGVSASFFFLLALLFAPIFLAIPGFATAPALIIVGFMMLSSAAEIDWLSPSEAIPAFLTIAAMPFAYSISDGIMFGIISYTIINLLSGKAKRVHWIMYILTALFLAKYALM